MADASTATYWVPPPPQHHHTEADADKAMEERSGSGTIKKFAIGLVVVFLIFAIFWWIWMSLCSGTNDEDESDKGTFCQLMDGMANVMNDIAAGVTYITTHLLLVAAIAVSGLAALILCKLGTCVDRITDFYKWATEKSEGESPDTGGTTGEPGDETDPGGKSEEGGKSEDGGKSEGE